RIGLQYLLGGISGLCLVPRLLIRAHQQLERVFLHHAVRILREECFEPADLGGWIALLNGAYVGVIFRRVLDFLFLLRRGLPVGLSLSWLLRRGGRGRGLSDSGGGGQQHGRELNLHHVAWLLNSLGKLESTACPVHPSSTAGH